MQFKRKAAMKVNADSPSVRESMLEGEDQAHLLVIKNLDSNKLERYKNEEHLQESLLAKVKELPEVEQILESMWEKYLTDYEREEEEYLEACYQGDVKKVKECVANKSKHPLDPRRCCNDEGKNGIHLATLSGTYRNLEIIRVLVDYGVDINGTTSLELRTPLMLATITGNAEAAEELLKLKADVKAKDYEGNTPLHLACIYNQ